MSDISGYKYLHPNHILFNALQSYENKWILETESKWLTVLSIFTILEVKIPLPFLLDE